MLIIGVFVFQLGVIGEYVNMIFGKNLLILSVYIILAIINTFLNVMLIPAIGAMGAAIAMLVSYICYSIFNLLYCQRFLKFSLKISELLKILFSGFLMTYVLFLLKKLLPNINALFFLPICVIFYCVILYNLRFFTANEIRLFKSLIIKKDIQYENV
jgi:O-antigen/teichoic acid export membrane protein